MTLSALRSVIGRSGSTALRAAVVTACTLAGSAAAQQAGVQAGTVATPPTDRSNTNYISNRAPLAPSPLVKLPVGAIRPEGWLRGQLELMRDGMTGKLAGISKWCKFEGSAWASPTGEGEFGWEELPYWLKGYGDLGYVLGDVVVQENARAWTDAVLAGQDKDGYIGPRTNREKRDVWPNMPMLNTLQTYYEFSGDARVLEAMTRYFKWQASIPKDQLLPESWQKVRAGDNIESIFWLYNRTGEAWLLDLARTLHEGTIRWDQGVANWHGVNITQGFREPAVFWMLSKDPANLSAAERNYREVMSLYGQVPGGMFGADENCRRGYGDPRQGAETCSMVEFMHSFQMLAGITGSALYGDRCEEVAFNSLPAAFTPDYKGLHYLTAANQVQLDKENKAPGIQNDGTMFSYDAHDYRCCQHNHAFGWPYFAEHLWMATSDDGLAAVLYAAGEVRARVGSDADAGQVSITQETDYPFDENIVLKVKAARPVKFPLYLRVPAWCPDPTVSINGQPVQLPAGRGARYIRLERQWATGDSVHLQLPMEIAVTHWEANKDAVSVSRGPLTYSLRIGEKWVRYGGTDDFPALEVFPTTPWNYGLVLDEKNPSGSFGVVRKTGLLGKQPFTNQGAVELKAKARRIPGWVLDSRGLLTTLQKSPAKSSEPVEEVTLVPMGGARLRISAFPVIGDGPDAHEWTPPAPSRHAASYEYDDINALSDGIVPGSSNDHSVPRFTFWSHRGTTEWVTYSFGKPREVSECAVYWFDDTGDGQCRVPASWTLYSKGPDGFSWEPVKASGPFGTGADVLNRVRFEPVTTTALKLEVVLQDKFSGGILEWAVGP